MTLEQSWAINIKLHETLNTFQGAFLCVNVLKFKICS
jgi:hypothetical protein